MSKFTIAKPGYDLETETDGNNLVYSTDYQYLIEASSGTADTNASGNLTITHNLGYVPAFVVFVSSDSATWYSHDRTSYVYATSTTLVIVGAMSGSQAKVYYSIFSSEI